MQSFNNSSTTPLRANAIFIGSWDDILNYQNIQVSLYSNSDCEITYYFSNDKGYVDSTLYSYTSGSNYTNSINNTARYVYFTVRNISVATNQTIFNFSVLYHSSPAPYSIVDVNVTNPILDVSDSTTHAKLDTAILDLDKFTFDVGNNLYVNLNGLNPAFVENSTSLRTYVTNTLLDVSNSSLSTMTFNTGRLEVLDTDANAKLTNAVTDLDKFTFDGGSNLYTNITNTLLDVSNSTLSAMTFDTNRLTVLDSDANTKLTNVYNILNSRGSYQLHNGAITAGALTTSVDLSGIVVSNLSIYGTQDFSGNILTLCFSNDDSTFYKSQYNYTFGASVYGDFGFNVTCCPRYASVESENACNLTLYLDHS